MPSRCLSPILVASLAATALLVPLALAQVGPVVPAFTLDARPNAAEVYPNETATFDVTVGNPGAISRNGTMSLPPQLPAGWTYAFSRDFVVVPAQATNTTRLSIFVPANAAPGTIAISFEVDDELSEATRANVTVTVKERPVSQSTTSTPPPPRLTLSVSVGDSARSGETVQGTLVVENHDTSRPSVSVQITPIASGGWSPFVRDADRNRVLTPLASATIPIFVQVPPLTEDATKDLDITVATQGITYTARWTVTGRAAPPTQVFDPAQPTPPTSAPSTSGTGSPLPPPASANLDILVEPLEVEIPSAGTKTAVVHLHNTGTTALTLTLAATPPDAWQPFTFQPATPIELGPGDRADVAMTIRAPDVPPGGQTRARVMAVDDGFARSASFVIRTTPAAPRDTSEVSAVDVPTDPDGGAPIAGPSVLVVVGLAAAGGAAALLASRPLRESLLWGAAGLYTRLARPDVRGHEDREKLYRLVETQPGIHFHALQRDLGWNTGTLTYHVRVLERHGFVVSRRDGLYRRFYLSGAAPRKEVFENQGPTGLRADVMEAIRNAPGISQTDLALGLGANKQTVNYHVKALERAGTIRVEKRGRDTYLYPGDAVASPGQAEA